MTKQEEEAYEVMTANRDHWRNLFKTLHHELNMELRNPNGTIWEYAKRLQDENDELKNRIQQ